MLRPKIINSGTRHGEFKDFPSETWEKSHPWTPPLMADEMRISHNPWRDLKDLHLWNLQTLFIGRLGSAALMVVFTDCRGLCQPKLFHDYKIKRFYFCYVAGLDQMEGCGQGPISTVSIAPQALQGGSWHCAFPSITTVESRGTAATGLLGCQGLCAFIYCYFKCQVSHHLCETSESSWY